jgi:hypothetical protein
VWQPCHWHDGTVAAELAALNLAEGQAAAAVVNDDPNRRAGCGPFPCAVKGNGSQPVVAVAQGQNGNSASHRPGPQPVVVWCRAHNAGAGDPAERRTLIQTLTTHAYLFHHTAALPTRLGPNGSAKGPVTSGSRHGRYHTGRQPGDAAQYTARSQLSKTAASICTCTWAA